MDTHILRPDTQAILLLCGNFSKPRSSVLPLSSAEYHRLAQSLYIHHMRPADLLLQDGLQRLQEVGGELLFDINRLERLLNRGAALALAVESWTNKGLWVISRGDNYYPQRIKTLLGREAPPILYGVGNVDLLNVGGLAIVGSRDVDDIGLEFTRTIGQCCAEQGLQVVSGGARGVDVEAMQAAFTAGGTAIGVLADSLIKAAVAGKYRSALRNRRLVLVSPYNPDAGFSVGNAMRRNKLVYAMSDYALVVSTSFEQGGTWAGAVENLARGWVPLFVRSGVNVPEGNKRLLDRGTIAFSEAIFDVHLSLVEWLANQASSHASKHKFVGEGTARCVEDIQTDEVGLEVVRQSFDTVSTAELSAPIDSGQAVLTSELEPESTALPSVDLSNRADFHHSAASPEARMKTLHGQGDTGSTKQSINLFSVILPYLEQTLSTPKTEREVADLLQIELGQARNWLNQAVKSGHVKKLARPVRYIAHSQAPSMF